MTCQQRRPRRRAPWPILATVLLAPFLSVLAIEARISVAARGAVYREVGAVPTRRVAIVFGAQILPGGILSAALAGRVDAAIALYQAGKVQQLLMTGDNREDNYNEPDAMRDYALARGIPAAAIRTDPAGLRTYDSCYRARDEYGVRPGEAVVVTQEYHLPRAIYTCSGLGLDVVGFAAAPFSGPRAREAELREHPARWLAWWQITISHPIPPTVR